MPVIELSLLLLLAIAVGGALVHWTPLPLPILLVVVGVLASFLPGLDNIEVDPELFLLLFIPPILFADAWVLPRRDFVQALKPVLLLALALVVLTVVRAVDSDRSHCGNVLSRARSGGLSGRGVDRPEACV